MCYIQCGFSISYLSIPGTAAHERCNISDIFTFSFQFQCCAVPFIYTAIFWEDSKLGSVVGAMWGMWVMIICFKIGLLNYSQCLWSPFLLVPNNWDLL